MVCTQTSNNQTQKPLTVLGWDYRGYREADLRLCFRTCKTLDDVAHICTTSNQQPEIKLLLKIRSKNIAEIILRSTKHAMIPRAGL